MIDLSDICGLPLYLDEETGTLQYGEEVECTFQKEIGLKEIIPILLNKFLKYPEQVYKQYVDVKNYECKHKDAGISYDIIQLPSGLLGIEYIKTHVYRSEEKEGKYSSIIEVTKGILTVIIQKNDNSNIDPFSSTVVKDVKIIELIAGDRFAIPSGVLYTFVNTSNDQVVFVVISNSLSHLDYTRNLIKEKGLAYFIISKNARLEVVANPKYKIEKPVEKHKWRKMQDEEKSVFSNDFVNSSDSMYNLLSNSFADLANVLV